MGATHSRAHTFHRITPQMAKMFWKIDTKIGRVMTSDSKVMGEKDPNINERANNYLSRV